VINSVDCCDKDNWQWETKVGPTLGTLLAHKYHMYSPFRKYLCVLLKLEFGAKIMGEVWGKNGMFASSLTGYRKSIIMAAVLYSFSLSKGVYSDLVK
jgi:hypothetical protein